MTDASASKMRPALIGGLVLGVASGIPFVNFLNCACCLWVIIGGVIASYLYTKDSVLKVSYGDAAVLGLFTGVFGAVIATIVSLPLTLMFNIGGSGQMEEALEQMRSDPNIPPEFLEFIEWMVDSGMLSAGFSVVGLLFSIIIYALFAMLGAIIGIAIFQKDKGSAPPPPAAKVSSTPPPPSGMGGSGSAGSSGAASGGGTSGGTPPPPGGTSAAPPPSAPSGGTGGASQGGASDPPPPAGEPSAPSAPGGDDEPEDNKPGS